MNDSLYSIRDLELLSGIKAHTIRIWEKRYDLLNPERTQTNIRNYCDNDLRKLLNIAMLVKHGYKISKVSTFPEEKIRELIVSIQENTKGSSHFVDTLLLHMVNFNDNEFNALINQIVTTFGFEEAFVDVIFPFFQKIGIYWQVGSIFPAQEHYVSNLIRQKIIAEIDRNYSNQTRKETILFYLRQNEQHELSLLFYSLMALLRGYKIIYLGQSVPMDDLKKIGATLDTDFVFTAFINSIEKENLQGHLNLLSEYFQGKRVFITGHQLEIHEPDLPRNFKIIASHKDFSKYLGKA